MFPVRGRYRRVLLGRQGSPPSASTPTGYWSLEPIYRLNRYYLARKLVPALITPRHTSLSFFLLSSYAHQRECKGLFPQCPSTGRATCFPSTQNNSISIFNLKVFFSSFLPLSCFSIIVMANSDTDTQARGGECARLHWIKTVTPLALLYPHDSCALNTAIRVPL